MERRAVDRIAGLGLALAIAVACGTVRADEGVAGSRVVVLPPRSEGAVDAAALNRAVLRAVERLERFELAPQPTLDLEATQLAIDCVGETARCMREVATRTQGRILIAPAVESEAGELVLSILCFDCEGGGEIRRAIRRHPGERIDRKALGQIPSMLEELFDGEAVAKASPKPARGARPEPMAEADAEPEPPAEAAATPSHAAEATATEGSAARAFPLGSVLLASAGVVTLGAGVGMGALAGRTEDAYAARRIDSPEAARAADDERRRGERQALVANVLLGAGAAALLAGAIWLAIDLGAAEEPPQTALVPAIGEDWAGVTLHGTFGARQ